ncbi:alpha/beta fold hydrolase [Pseudoblastomonas halimionae]|uniref:Alpha/beta fold hydrolase n=1 Tax=Alteriqipengyuania halimionae TaxID=1926630 RepID=A0A6I4U275_9SPHN|nr:alpha/beta hydrolase [Alteriqipengyuania halimionae]MXP09033.1 alpha/beta fold hydrolase [Alteriqipengyuania halimionae]
MKWVWRILGAVVVLGVIGFLVFRTPDTDPGDMRAKYGGAPSQFVTLDNGMTVHLRDEGPRDAPAIVLLHGSNADLHTWQPWVEALRERYRVIRFDQRGHGLTGPGTGDIYALEAFVGDVDAVADALGLDRFVLGGNSMGGWIAAGYAIEHPERLDGLVLVDAAGAPIEREGGGNLAFTLARLPGLGAVLSQMLPRSLVEKSLSQSVSNQAVVTPEAVDRYWELTRYPGNRDATRARFSTERRAFTAEDIASLDIPTLVMWGEEDALIPVEAARWYGTHLSRSTLAIYPGIGHLPMEEAPARSLDDLTRWLKTLGPQEPVS